MSTQDLITVAVLDDHQSAIDGYEFRFKDSPNIQIKIRANNAAELLEGLSKTSVNVLLLDISVPISQDDKKEIPLFFFIPDLQKKYPDIKILVISMHNEAKLIQSVMDAGASGYIVKDDRASITKLAEIVETIAGGDYHFSKDSFESLLDGQRKNPAVTLVNRPAVTSPIALCLDA